MRISLKGIVVNRECPSLNGSSLKISPAVPLNCLCFCLEILSTSFHDVDSSWSTSPYPVLPLDYSQPTP